MRTSSVLSFFFFNDTATTEIYTLSLHDALPIFRSGSCRTGRGFQPAAFRQAPHGSRSEEHTSELQSRGHLVCRLLLEKKKKKTTTTKKQRNRTHRTTPPTLTPSTAATRTKSRCP